MTANPMTGQSAKALATRLEIVTQDLLSPVEIIPRFNATGEPTGFKLVLSLPDATVPTGDSEAATARAIASQFAAWAQRLQAVASAIQERYPIGPAV